MLQLGSLLLIYRYYWLISTTLYVDVDDQKSINVLKSPCPTYFSMKQKKQGHKSCQTNCPRMCVETAKQNRVCWPRPV